MYWRQQFSIMKPTLYELERGPVEIRTETFEEFVDTEHPLASI